MPKHIRYITPVILGVALLAGGVTALSRTHSAVLSPAGIVARQQRSLLITATVLMLLIVVPVFVLTFVIAWKYRAGNTKAAYHPEWDHNTKLELLWWGLPCAIILVLATLAWRTTHSLDPTRDLQSDKAPLTIQVIALQWKWLFIYPEQHVASLNYVRFPAGRPVNFEITADAPMNSFWIPRLGGQIYAMSGMTTNLHLMADAPGTYTGTSANLSGAGFAAMHFPAQATSDADFSNWISSVQSGPHQLTLSAYTALALPSVAARNVQFSWIEPDLYTTVMMKYMAPSKRVAAPRQADGTTAPHVPSMTMTDMNSTDMPGGSR